MIHNVCHVFGFYFSGMEYEVTPEKALEHQEVQERISRSVETLKQATEAFLAAILQNIQMIPYVYVTCL